MDVQFDISSIYFGLQTLKDLEQNFISLSSAFNGVTISSSLSSSAPLFEAAKKDINNATNSTIHNLVTLLENSKKILEECDREAALLFKYYEEGILTEDGKWTAVPLMNQDDYGDITYSQGSVKTSGCGLTSLCMVASYILGELYTPEDLAAIANADKSSNVGKMTTAADYVGLDWVRDQNTSREDLINYLNEGKMVICLVKGSSHFVLCTGVNENGQIEVNDPYSPFRQESHKDGYDWNELQFSAGSTWIFDPAQNTGSKVVNDKVTVDQTVLDRLAEQGIDLNAMNNVVPETVEEHPQQETAETTPETTPTTVQETTPQEQTTVTQTTTTLSKSNNKSAVYEKPEQPASNEQQLEQTRTQSRLQNQTLKEEIYHSNNKQTTTSSNTSTGSQNSYTQTTSNATTSNQQSTATSSNNTDYMNSSSSSMSSPNGTYSTSSGSNTSNGGQNSYSQSTSNATTSNQQSNTTSSTNTDYMNSSSSSMSSQNGTYSTSTNSTNTQVETSTEINTSTQIETITETTTSSTSTTQQPAIENIPQPELTPNKSEIQIQETPTSSTESITIDNDLSNGTTEITPNDYNNNQTQQDLSSDSTYNKSALELLVDQTNTQLQPEQTPIKETPQEQQIIGSINNETQISIKTETNNIRSSSSTSKPSKIEEDYYLNQKEEVEDTYYPPTEETIIDYELPSESEYTDSQTSSTIDTLVSEDNQEYLNSTDLTPVPFVSEEKITNNSTTSNKVEEHDSSWIPGAIGVATVAAAGLATYGAVKKAKKNNE